MQAATEPANNGDTIHESMMLPIPVLPVPHQITPSAVSTKLNPTTAPITAWVVEIGSPSLVAHPTQIAAPIEACDFDVAGKHGAMGSMQSE